MLGDGDVSASSATLEQPVDGEFSRVAMDVEHHGSREFEVSTFSEDVPEEPVSQRSLFLASLSDSPGTF